MDHLPLNQSFHSNGQNINKIQATNNTVADNVAFVEVASFSQAWD